MFLPITLFPEVGKCCKVSSRSKATEPPAASSVLKGTQVLAVVAFKLIPRFFGWFHILKTDQEKIDLSCSSCSITF